MNIKSIIEDLGARIVHLEEPEREVNGGYCGDFLSNVISKAPADSVWFTVMHNQNVAAVQTLADISLTVLCEGVEPDETLRARVVDKGLNMIVTDLPVYEAVKAIK